MTKVRGVFPVSVSLGVYRVGGKGNGLFMCRAPEAVAAGGVAYAVLFAEGFEGVTKGGRAHPAELSELLDRSRLAQLCHGLKNSFNRR